MCQDYSAERCGCNFIDYELKGSIIFNLDTVWNTGSKKQNNFWGKITIKSCMFQPAILNLASSIHLFYPIV